VRFWADERVLALGVGAKLLGVYALSGPQTNRIGYYLFNVAKAAEDLRVQPGALERHFACLTDALLWEFDPGSRILLIPMWWRYHNPGNPKALAGYAKDFHVLPASPLLPKFVTVSRRALGPIRWPIFARACELEVGSAADDEPELFSVSAHQELIAHFVQAWADAHDGAKYTFRGGRDGALAKRILEQVDHDLTKAKRLVDLYFADGDDYMRQQGSTLSLLSSAVRLNKYIAAAAGAAESEFEKEWRERHGS
jgi:hypothetical protein